MFCKSKLRKGLTKSGGLYVQRTTGLLNCQMDFMVWCCDIITSTCLNMFSMNWTSFPRILFMSDLLIFAALLLPKNRCNTPQTLLLTFLETDKCKQVSVQTRLWPSYVPQGFNRKRVAFQYWYFWLAVEALIREWRLFTFIYIWKLKKQRNTMCLNCLCLKKKSEHCSTFCFN